MLESRPTNYPFVALLAGHFIVATLASILLVWISMPSFSLQPSSIVWSIAALLGPIVASEPVRRRSSVLFVGNANRITLFRGCMVSWLAAFVITDGTGHQAIWVSGVASVCLALDGLDGFIARKTNSVSDYGARFDMEFDAMLMLVLCWLAFHWGQAGPWVLFCGLARYVWGAATLKFLWLNKRVPGDFRRKTCCVIGVMGLIGAVSPLPFSVMWAAIATGTLALSFGMDLVWLVARRNAPTRS